VRLCQQRRLARRLIADRGCAVVIGGTGLIGSKTVAILRQGGHEVVAASPKSGINSITGEGLKEAMAGAQVVIDLANSPSTVISVPGPTNHLHRCLAATEIQKFPS
jgi:uncharacterized protein YbjT (DUF2867 family)